MVKMIVTKIKRRNILPIYIRCGVLYIYICYLHLMHMFYNLELHKCKRSNNVYCKSCVCIYICILFLVCCEVEICSDFQRKKLTICINICSCVNHGLLLFILLKVTILLLEMKALTFSLS